ncbi:MAG TPA: glycerol-3-phosphate 1-O-acyltransferase PlsY [Chthoniobacteraceae bacterium]|nr:glycerol-3-phosphate 1-O-acyltransferase PlsY [Chthoniobacteraceae bacterium]
MALVIATIVLVAYLLGSIPFGLLVSKSQGIDIRQHGSGNIGATNVWRVLGKKWGLMTFVGDMAKGWIAVVVGQYIASKMAISIPLPHGHERIEHLQADFAGIAAALGCILGHSFPVWLKFMGGKGVATSLGVIFGMMPLAALVDFALWGIVFKVSGYVSLASIVAALALPVLVIVFLLLGLLKGWGYFFFSVAAGMLVVWRHRENIKRLVAGTESSFKKRPPEPPEPPEPREPQPPMEMPPDKPPASPHSLN